MRIAVLGKTQSGRTTAARLLVAQLSRHFDEVILLDGKGNQLTGFPGFDFYGPDEVAEAADALGCLAEELPARHAGDCQKRVLLVADDVQHFTRAEKFGPKVKRHLSALAEAGTLGDWIIVTAPRLTGNVPPPCQHQLCAQVELIGNGYFFYRAAGTETVSGKLHPDPLPAPVADLPTADNLPGLLGSIQADSETSRATLYLGTPGAGKTHALRRHEANGVRRLYADLSLPQNGMLKELISRAGAPLPSRANTTELTEVACLAVAAEPTLLLLDNLQAVTPKQISNVQRILDAATAVALAANEPKTPAQRRKLTPFLPRCRTVELKPVPDETARQILWATIDRDSVADPGAVERRVVRAAGGNPGNVVKLAGRLETGDRAELREIYAPVRRVNVGWIVLVAVVALAMASRRYVDGYMALAMVTAATIVLRPLIYRAMRADE